MRPTPGLAFCAWLLILLLPGAAPAATPVVVFNFQMKSDTPEWKWLEKGLSDRITTDFVQDRALSPSRRQSSATEISPRRPSRTMRIFSSAPYCRRVARRIS
jgi:TolB-like protein